MIEVRDGRLGRGVYATRPIEVGEVILSGWGPRVPSRTRHSFQVGPDAHIEIRTPIELINHGCEPNCGAWLPRGAEVMEIHALRPIAPGTELSTDYATFEYEIEHMNNPCRCGALSCRGLILGYWALPAERRAAFGPYIAEYLRELDALIARAG